VSTYIITVTNNTIVIYYNIITSVYDNDKTAIKHAIVEKFDERYRYYDIIMYIIYSELYIMILRLALY